MSWGTQTGTGFTPTEEPKAEEPPKEDSGKKPARKQSPTKAKKKAAQGLFDALSFIQPATNDMQDYQEFARFSNKWAVAFDGALAMGHPIEEELNLCPHLGRLKAAIDKAGSTIAIAATENGRLSVSGEKLRAVVPCLPPERYPPVMPDVQCAVIDDRIKEGFKALTKLAKDEADKVHEATVLLRGNSMVATNGQLILEFWHGIDLPPGLAIPQRAAQALAKSTKPLTGFGFDWGRSATFYFEGGAWLKTQLYDEPWPNVDDILNIAAYPSDVPVGLWDGLDAIEKFSEDGGIHFDTDKLRSTYATMANDGAPELNYGATYDVPGLQARHSFTAKLLKLAQPACLQLDYTTHADRAVFYNNVANLRGVLMKRVAM